MPTVTYPSPSVALTSFIEAATKGDEQVARAAACPGSWARRGESALKAYAHLQEGFTLTALADPLTRGDRSVIPVAVAHPKSPERTSRRFVLMERVEGSWGFGALVESEPHAALFLSEALPAIFEIQDLPSDPMIDAWAARTAAKLRDQSLLTVEQLEQVADAPVLGVLPRWAESGAVAFDALADDHEVVLAYGDLAKRVLQAELGGALAVASSTAHEGAVQVVAHLGQIFAGLGQRTLLLDLNFQAPTLHLVFGSFESSPGLSDALLDGTPVEGGLRQIGENLTILPAGRREQLSGEAFQAFGKWFTQAREDYDQVVALLPRQGLASLAGALGFAPLLVAHAGAVPVAAVDATRREVDAGGARLAGTIATRLAPSSVPDPDLDPEVLRPFAEGEAHHVDALGSYALPGLHRAVGGLSQRPESGAHGVEAWTVFDTSGPDLTPLRSATAPTLDLLLTGVEASLPDSKARRTPDSQDVQKIIGAVLSGLGQSVGAFDMNDLSRLPESVADTVVNALRDAGQDDLAEELRRRAAEGIARGRSRGKADAEAIKRAVEGVAGEGAGGGATGDASSDPEGAQSESTESSTSTSEGASDSASSKKDPLKMNLRDAVRRFAQEKGDGRPVEELLRDREFMQAHSAEAARHILGAIVQTITPTEPSEAGVNLKGSGSGEPTQHAKLKLDLGGMLQNLLKASQAKRDRTED